MVRIATDELFTGLPPGTPVRASANFEITSQLRWNCTSDAGGASGNIPIRLSRRDGSDPLNWNIKHVGTPPSEIADGAVMFTITLRGRFEVGKMRGDQLVMLGRLNVRRTSEMFWNLPAWQGGGPPQMHLSYWQAMSPARSGILEFSMRKIREPRPRVTRQSRQAIERSAVYGCAMYVRAQFEPKDLPGTSNTRRASGWGMDGRLLFNQPRQQWWQ